MQNSEGAKTTPFLKTSSEFQTDLTFKNQYATDNLHLSLGFHFDAEGAKKNESEREHRKNHEVPRPSSGSGTPDRTLSYQRIFRPTLHADVNSEAFVLLKSSSALRLERKAIANIS